LLPGQGCILNQFFQDRLASRRWFSLAGSFKGLLDIRAQFNIGLLA
jgi:hypothetical protein